MSTNEIEEGGWLTSFLDRIWLQFALTTGITVLWLVWIIYEILIKDIPTVGA